MIEELDEFDPKEPIAFGQVWEYLIDHTIFMVVSHRNLTRSITLAAGSPHRITGRVDSEGSGWSTLTDHVPEYWTRLR